jgi:L-aspartate oxidase
MSPPADGTGARVDLLVVGSGAAGLTAAVEAVQLGLSVLVVTRTGAAAGSTRWAQGGIAVPLPSSAGSSVQTGQTDDLDLHVRDTLAAGAGLCESRAVRALLGDGPAAIERLLELGARFDTGPDGGLSRTREGGHSTFRIVRAGGDATGAEVERALLEAARDARVPMLTGYTVRSLLVGEHGQIVGASCAMAVAQGSSAPDLPPGADPPPAVLTVPARTVLLATGGLGALYATTTNHAVAIGDGLALALRAGAAVSDVEFVQFHPTALWVPGVSGRLPLVTEAVRGEGGLLLDARGRRFMVGVHPRAELAPRDVVAAAMTRVMAEEGSDHVRLDATGLEGFAERFPTVTAACRAAGIDPVAEPVPVLPAAHYLCGGVVCDLDGRTRVPGLFVAGEVARTGVHGANRLASNSLVEALVLGRRSAEAVARGLPDLPPHRGDLPRAEPPRKTDDAARTARMRRTMSRNVGIGRTAAGLQEALEQTAPPPEGLSDPCGRTALSALAARAVITAALAREESRGCHVREDFPSQDGPWERSLVLRLDGSGVDRQFTIDEGDRDRPMTAFQGGTS